MTFVLVLFLHATTAMHVPGYGTRDECESAGRAAFKDGGPGGKFGSPLVVGFMCIPGPRHGAGL